MVSEGTDQDQPSADEPQGHLGEPSVRSPSPPTSLLQQWGALLASPTEWLLPQSCVGCLSQIADNDHGHEGGDDAGSAVDRVLRAQGNQYDIHSSSDKHGQSIKSSKDGRGPGADVETISAAATTRHRLTNRSRAPRNFSRGRINDLVHKIQSMPTPTSIRDQILAVHCHYGNHPKGELEVVQPLSSTLSSPIYAARNLPGFYSPVGNRLRNSSGDSVRRTQSLRAPSKRILPVSRKSDGHIPNDHMKNPSLLDGIQFSDGAGLFSTAIDLNWCCPTSTDACAFLYSSGPKKVESELKGNTDCGGYVDYAGEFHPCTSVSQLDRHSQASTSKKRCQGCIFRRCMTVNKKTGRSDVEDDLYYDSDPGEQFFVDRAWMQVGSVQSTSSEDNHFNSNEKYTMQLNVGAGANSSITRHHVKLFMRKGKSKSRSTSNLGVEDHVAQHSKEEKRIFSQQKDHQAYIYDYFSQNAHPQNSMQTGICSTNSLDVGRCVQDALNSTWRLHWHANNTAKLCDVWIERGYRRNRTEIVEPKLMWREVPQSNLNEKRRLEVFTILPHQVNLFSVRRILQISNVSDGEVIDMDRHPQKHVLPFTKPNSLLLIRSSLDEDFMFEASCLVERDHIVHLLKIATARLVSHAVAGNGDMLLKEFFNDEHVP